MTFAIRPSKNFLFGKLKRELARFTVGVAVDAASADFKHRKKFRTHAYYGLDTDRAALQRGLARQQPSNTFGVQADITRLERLPGGSADVVVSTSTLYHLPDAEHMDQALGALIRIVKPGGSFLFDLLADASLARALALVRPEFARARVFYFKNALSRAYERLFEQGPDGNLGTHPIAGRLPMRIIAFVIGLTEYLTCHAPGPRKHAFVIADNKRGGEAHAFDLAHLPQIAPGLFNAMMPEDQHA